MYRRRWLNLRAFGGLLVAFVLPMVAACGAAATATPVPTSAPQPAAVQPTAPAAVATAVPAPTSAQVNPVVSPGKVTWMIGAWANGRFDYAFSPGGANNYARVLHGLLIVTNEKAELLPGIATKWEISADGKTWTFTIRDGAKFHDGKEITAEDVWWTWMHYWGKDASGSAQERATNASAQTVARFVEKIELTAFNKVSFTRTSPDASFPGFITSELSNATVAVLPRRPKVHDSAQEAAYDENPIGAGPGKLVKHVQADLMAFERFEDYYYQPKNGLPVDRRLKFKSLDLRLIPEEATRVAALRAGDADIAPVSLASRRQVEAGGGRLVFGSEGVAFEVLLAGCYKSQYPCHDKRVRQALDLAIDKTVIGKLFGGPEVFQVKGFVSVTPSTIGYSPDLDPWPQDVARARQLLAEAGYPGGKGFGKLIVHTWVSSAMPFLPESAQLAADYWRRELGLDVEVKVGDETAIKKARQAYELDGQVRWVDIEGRQDAAGFGSNYGVPGHSNRLHEDPALFELVNETLAVVDPAKRGAAFNKLYKRLREETYNLGIGYVNIPWAVGPRIQTWEPYPLSFYPSALHTVVLK